MISHCINLQHHKSPCELGITYRGASSIGAFASSLRESISFGIISQRHRIAAIGWRYVQVDGRRLLLPAETDMSALFGS